MPKYLITWDIGYGPNEEFVEADDDDKAQEKAYELAREDFENHAKYSAKLFTPEVANEHGYVWEPEE